MGIRYRPCWDGSSYALTGGRVADSGGGIPSSVPSRRLVRTRCSSERHRGVTRASQHCRRNCGWLSVTSQKRTVTLMNKSKNLLRLTRYAPQSKWGHLSSQQKKPSDTIVRKGVCVRRAGILTWTNQGHDVYMAKVSQKHNATRVDKSANLGYYKLASGGVAKRLVLSINFSTPVASSLLSRRCLRVSVLY